MANIPTASWDESKPAGSRSIKLGDNDIRELKTQIREVIGVDHDFPSAGNATDNGQHLRCTFQEQSNLGSGATGVTILGAQTISGKPELVYTDEDDNDIQLTKGGVGYPSQSTVLADWSKVIGLIYPVGSIYINAGVSTNPGTLLGVGTWVAFGEGKVIFGISGSDSDFDSLSDTGGSKTTTIAAHTHTGTTTAGNNSAPTGYGQGGESSHTHDFTTASGGSSTPAIVPPYVTAYFWKRTA